MKKRFFAFICIRWLSAAEALLEHLAGVHARRVRHRLAPQHARDFLDALGLGRARRRSVSVRPRSTCLRTARWRSANAAICGRCVTHSTCCLSAMACSFRPTTSATRPPIPASTSSNTSVLPRRVGARHRLEREHDARQLAARRDARERPQLLARVGREQELGRSRPASVQRRGSAPAARRRLGREEHLEARLLHGQLGELGLHPLARGRAPTRAPPLRQRPRPRRGRPAPRASRRSSSSRSCSSGDRSSSSSARHFAPNASTSSTRRAVLPLEPLDERQARLDLVEPAGADLEPLAVVAQEQREVVELGAHGRPSPPGAAGTGIDRAELLDALEDLPEPREHRRLVLEEQRVGLAAQAGEPAGVGLERLLAAERLFLAGLERRLLDLAAWNSSISRRRSPSRRSRRRRSSAASAAAQARNGLGDRPQALVAARSGRRARGARPGRAGPAARAGRGSTARCGARSRSRLTGTSAPLTVALPLPLACISRRSTTSSPSSGSAALVEERAARPAASKTASTTARSSPVRMRSAEARSPEHAGRARRSGSTCRRPFRPSGASAPCRAPAPARG